MEAKASAVGYFFACSHMATANQGRYHHGSEKANMIPMVQKERSEQSQMFTVHKIFIDKRDYFVYNKLRGNFSDNI